MKIRIKGNSIRLRLTKSEVEEVERKSIFKEETHFAQGVHFEYAVELADTTTPQALFEQNKIKVLLPREMGLNWCRSEQVGISHSIELANGDTLQILVEKDFACLVSRPGEDESDHFDNPNTHC